MATLIACWHHEMAGPNVLLSVLATLQHLLGFSSSLAAGRLSWQAQGVAVEIKTSFGCLSNFAEK